MTGNLIHRMRAGPVTRRDRLADIIGAFGRHVGRTHAPAEELDHRILERRRRLGCFEGARHRHTHGIRVDLVVARVRCTDLAVYSAIATLEDLSVFVDEEVVADVAPAVAVHVIGLIASHDFCRIGLRVRVAARGVVHDDATSRATGGWRIARRVLACPPGSAQDNCRLRGVGRRPVGSLLSESGSVQQAGGGIQRGRHRRRIGR